MPLLMGCSRGSSLPLTDPCRHRGDAAAGTLVWRGRDPVHDRDDRPIL